MDTPKENPVATVLLAACICRSAVFGEARRRQLQLTHSRHATNKDHYRSDAKLLSRTTKGGR